MTATVTAPETRTDLDGLAATILLGCSFVWGLNQVAIKVANLSLQPVFQAGLRSLVGGILVLLWCWYRGIRLFERDGTLPAGIIAGILFCAEFVLIYIGLDFTTVSRGIVFLYTMPFFVAVGAHFFLPGERLTTIKVVGLAAAFVGVVAVFADRLSLPSPRALIGDVLCLIAASIWAATTIFIKRSRLVRIAPEKALMYQLAVSAVGILALSPLYGPFVRTFSVLGAVAFAYQAVIVVAISYVAWFWLLKHYPAARLSSFIFLTPVFAVALGWLLLGEPVSVWLGLAVALVAVGIYLVNRPQRPAVVASGR